MTPFGIVTLIGFILLLLFIVVWTVMKYGFGISLKSASSPVRGSFAAELSGKSQANAYLSSKMKEFAGLSFKDLAGGTIATIILAVFVGAYLISMIVMRWDFETPTNIKNKANDAVSVYSSYATNPPRKMSDAIEFVKKKQGAEVAVLTNFYIMTANLAGLGYSTDKGGKSRAVYNKDILRLSLQGGARAFILECWPDSKGSPVIQTVESGSMWRRTSWNSVPLVTVLSDLTTYAFPAGAPATELIIVYLRFRTKEGKIPAKTTMNLAANALQSTIQPYRMDAAFNRCRAQDTIALLPLASFAGKVLVVCNFNGVGSELADYINISHQTPDPVQVLDSDTKYAKNLPPSAKLATTNTVKHQLTFTAPYSEDPDAESNAWDVAGAQDLGVHCCGINMDPKKGVAYKVPKMFETYSYSLKPGVATTATTGAESFVGSSLQETQDLLYRPEHLPKPLTPPAKFAAMGTGPNPGSIKTPPAMNLLF